MDYIRQADWSYGDTDVEFLTGAQLATSSMSSIISGTFRNPLCSSESEDEQHDIDSMILAELQRSDGTRNKNKRKDFIPGLRPLPAFPKLSSLTQAQHYIGVRVLAEQNRTTHSYACGPPPTQKDYEEFESMQKAYILEQQEFLEWARREWVTNQCLRALRPPPLMERAYDALWAAEAAAFSSLPLTYQYSAQISLAPESGQHELSHVQDLKTVDISRLPTVVLPPLNQIQSVCALPDEQFPHVCKRHPCRTVLPDEDKLCALSMSVIQSELAMFAGANGASFIVSERALKCLLQLERQWTLPILAESVLIGGKQCTVIVMGGEVAPSKLLTRHRIARAVQLLLRHTVTNHIKDQLDHRIEDNSVSMDDTRTENIEKEKEHPEEANSQVQINEDSCDEEDDLIIDMGEEENAAMDNKQNEITNDGVKVTQHPGAQSEPPPREPSGPSLPSGDILDMLNKCTCKGTPFEEPPLVSYTKWKLGRKSGDYIPLIIHCHHKHVKDSETEVILNAIPEFQVDLAGAAQSVGKMKSDALAMQLRKKAVVLSSRIEVQHGHIVSYEWSEREQMESAYSGGGRLASETAAALYTVLSQLTLDPGHYILQHEPAVHGDNAILYAALQGNTGPDNLETISLAAQNTVSTEKETKHLQVPPVLGPALLPVHKLRRTLPLAFSPFPPPPHLRRKPSKDELKQNAIKAEKRQKKQRINIKKKMKRKLKIKGNKNEQNKNT